MDIQDVGKRWKMIGAGTALAAMGIVGFGFADSGDRLSLPDAIKLRDSVPVSEAANDLAAPAFEIIPAPILGGNDSLSSPFDSAPAAPAGAPAAAPAGIAGDSVSLDSFDAPAQPAPVQFDSPDSFSSDSVDAPAPQRAPVQSFDSPQSFSNDSFSNSFDSDSLTS